MTKLRAVTTVYEGREAVGYLRVQHEEYSSEGRPVYHYSIRDGAGTTLEERTDLEGGVGEEPDARKATGTLIGFLGAAADAYRAGMEGRESDNSDLFKPQTMLFAYRYSEELGMLGIEFEEPTIGTEL